LEKDASRPETAGTALDSARQNADLDGSPVTPSDGIPDTLELTSDQQRAAASGAHRTQILLQLGDGQASISEIAERLAIPRGTVAYHMRILREAGLVYIADTRRVRAVTERYYARVARSYVVHHTSGLGVGDRGVIHEFLADYGGCTDITVETPAMQLRRIPLAEAQRLAIEMDRLLADFTDANPSDGSVVDVGVIAGVYWRNSLR
jgi:DNA-binding transcriptional ArsR family regulator